MDHIIHLMTTQGDSYLDPTHFNEGEIDRFIRDYICICGSHLLKVPAGRLFNARCPACDLLISEYNFQHKADLEKSQDQQLQAERELRPDQPKKSQDEILRELGF